MVYRRSKRKRERERRRAIWLDDLCICNQALLCVVRELDGLCEFHIIAVIGYTCNKPTQYNSYALKRVTADL